MRCLTSEGRPRAAMYVRSSLAVLSLRHLAGRDIVVAQVGYGNTLIYFTSGYLPQNHWEDTLERIEVALDGCGDGLMVLGLDANAYSAAWHSPQLRERDHRGMFRRGDALAGVTMTLLASWEIEIAPSIVDQLPGLSWPNMSDTSSWYR